MMSIPEGKYSGPGGEPKGALPTYTVERTVLPGGATICVRGAVASAP